MIADHDLDGVAGEGGGFEGAPAEALIHGGGAGGPEVDSRDVVGLGEGDDVGDQGGGDAHVARGWGDVEAGEPRGEVVVGREVGFVEGDGAEDFVVADGEEGDGDSIALEVLASKADHSVWNQSANVGMAVGRSAKGTICQDEAGGIGDAGDGE